MQNFPLLSVTFPHSIELLFCLSTLVAFRFFLALKLGPTLHFLLPMLHYFEAVLKFLSVVSA